MFHFAGIFLKDSFVVILGGIYLVNSPESGRANIMGLSREPVTVLTKAWRNGVK